MYKRLSAILFPLTLVALIGLGVWGYQENKEKNTILIKAENQYQRAFHELNYYTDQLNTELGNVAVVNPTSPNFYRKELANIWRLTSEAQNRISQLPLAMVPLSKTQEMLHQMSKFSYQTSIRDMTSKPLTTEEKKTLNDLYARSNDIKGELVKVQSEILAKNLRWMDVEQALASQKENLDNAIIDGMQAMDKKVSGYEKIQWSPSVVSGQNRLLNDLPGADATADEIRTKAAGFFGMTDGSALTVKEHGKGTDSPTYTVTKDGYSLDYSKKGGCFLQFMNPRQVTQKNIDMRAARDAALDFLDKHGFHDMTPVSYDEYGNSAALTFARRSNDVTLYPEKVMVNVALDNGDITDMEAIEYAFEHKERKVGKAKISPEQAKKELNPKLVIQDQDMCLIKNELNEEVLCYEFFGKLNDISYRIYINADTGEEEKIEQSSKSL